MFFTRRNLISNGLSCPVHAKSTCEFRLSLDLAIGQSEVWSQVAEIKLGTERLLRPNYSLKCLHFWLIFGLSPNLGLGDSLSKRLIQKVKWPSVIRVWNSSSLLYTDIRMDSVRCSLKAFLLSRYYRSALEVRWMPSVNRQLTCETRARPRYRYQSGNKTFFNKKPS